MKKLTNQEKGYYILLLVSVLYFVIRGLSS